jgi:hypothetical protein
MSKDNWLIKLCSEQPTNEAELEQALLELPSEELMALDPNPTQHLDEMPDKIAFADQMGRELAHQDPGLLQQEEENAELAQVVASLSDEDAVKVAAALDSGELTKEAFLGAVGRLAGKAMTSGVGKKITKTIANNPLAATTAAGAAGGALMGGEGNRLQGALGGAALGLGGGALAGRQAIRKGMGQLYGRAAKAARPGVSATRARRAGMVGPLRPTGKFAAAEKLAKVSLPMAITGPRLSKMVGGKVQDATHLIGKKAPPIPGTKSAKGGLLPGVHKRASIEGGKEKKAYMDHGHRDEWLAQFEGTPLLEQALEMAQQELQLEMQQIEERQERPDSFAEQDKIRAQKKLLELQLVAQRNGLSEPDGDELGGPATTADHPEPEGDEYDHEEVEGEEEENPAEAAVASPAGQQAVQAIKEAGIKLANSQPITVENAGHAEWQAQEKTANWKRRAALGLGALGVAGLGAAGGSHVGKKKGLSEGRTQGAKAGIQWGLRRGYQAGAQRGFRAGIQYGRTHTAPKKSGKEKKAHFPT